MGKGDRMKWIMIFLIPFIIDDIFNIIVLGNSLAIIGRNCLLFFFGGLVYKWVFIK
jgi:hypothetical protein